MRPSSGSVRSSWAVNVGRRGASGEEYGHYPTASARLPQVQSKLAGAQNTLSKGMNPGRKQLCRQCIIQGSPDRGGMTSAHARVLNCALALA